jgi:acetolactate synthase-1/2/3 large subunit
VVHVDIDPSSIGKTVRAHVPIVGDARTVLGQLLDSIATPPPEPLEQREGWLRGIDIHKRHQSTRYAPSGPLKPQFVIEQIHRATGGEAIVATEVGQHQMWTAQFYPFRRPRAFLSSGGLGTMGYGLPAAIGAQVAFPHRTVFDIAGDGSIQMNIQELATLVQYRLPVKIAVLNNGSLGMVRQWQSLFFEGRCSQTIFEAQPDFVKLAQAYGLVGLRATCAEEVASCVEEALLIDGPVLMDFHVDPNEHVYPMVPPGCGLGEMITEPPTCGKEDEKRTAGAVS